MPEYSAVDQARLDYLQFLLNANYKMRFRTFLFGKPYVWIQDPVGTWFLERLPNEGIIPE